MVKNYTGSNTVEHYLGGMTKHRKNTMFWTNSNTAINMQIYGVVFFINL